MGAANSKQEAFWEACGFGHTAKVKKFLQEGIDVNWVSYTHNSCAIHVASQGKPDIVKLLIEAKCDVNVKDERECLPIHHAAMKGFGEIINILLDNKSQLNPVDKTGWSPLIMAAYWCQPSAVEVLLERGCDVHLKNKDERTALHECARSPSADQDMLGEIAAKLIKAGCDINAKSSDLGEADFTPLMFACYHGHLEVARQLVQSGCLIDSQGTNGWTALHWASDRDQADIVKFLLESGINSSLKGRRGELAVDRARSEEVRQLFPDLSSPEKEELPPTISSSDGLKDKDQNSPTGESADFVETKDADDQQENESQQMASSSSPSTGKDEKEEAGEEEEKDEKVETKAEKEDEENGQKSGCVSESAGDNNDEKRVEDDPVVTVVCEADVDDADGRSVKEDMGQYNPNNACEEDCAVAAATDDDCQKTTEDVEEDGNREDMKLGSTDVSSAKNGNDSAVEDDVGDESTEVEIVDCPLNAESSVGMGNVDECDDDRGQNGNKDYNGGGLKDGSVHLDSNSAEETGASILNQPASSDVTSGASLAEDAGKDVEDLLAGIENVNLTQYLIKRSNSKTSSLSAEGTSTVENST